MSLIPSSQPGNDLSVDGSHSASTDPPSTTPIAPSPQISSLGTPRVSINSAQQSQDSSISHQPEQFSTSTAFRASSFSSETAPQAQVSLMASPQPGNDLAANRPHSASTDLPVPNANADVDSGTIVDDPAPAGNSASGVAVIPEFEATTPTPAADMGPAASPDGAQSDPDSDLTPAP
ncbi:hypothetical protein DXG01_014663, partial [Tephrocybe rancida]